MMERKPGMFRYYSFGLRQEWVELFFAIRSEVLYNSSLGPYQKGALRYYLNDMELVDAKNEPTDFFNNIFTIFRVEGIGSHFFWSLVWNNLSYNAPLFEWWNDKSIGRYTREAITSQLSGLHGRLNRSISNAYQSLIGTLERTPIGTELKQGIVQKEGRSRVVIKEGNPDISPFAVLYALYKLAEQTQEYQIDLQAVEHTSFSPQKVFTIDTGKVDALLRSLWVPDLFQIKNEGDRVYIRLEEDKRGLDVVDRYIERL